ncbi:MAG TPA: pyridoxal phosphate-dependent aminotransferase [Terracidiphilus sp.]|jgi:histidinol-phosphate aminotransferase|nr:pyridoxal phosphate-dependent aminotransferase [Terracidiphilus sp.]
MLAQDPVLSRRSFFRFAAGASALAAFPIVSEAHLAYAQRAHRSGDPNKGIHIDSNENPMGPCDAARQVIADLIPKGGRYFFNMEEEVVNLFAQQEGLDPKYVRLYAGSSEPLAYTVLAFTSPTSPLVTADPGYEAAEWSAANAGAPVVKIRLADPAGAAPHDIRAMIAASPSTGVIYICNPNNPTGTCTPRADIAYAIDHAPKNTVILIDEAYIHFCDQPRSLDYVKQGRNVIVLRTFSKIYGMAGLRMGFAIGRPDLLKKLDYFGRNMLPASAMFATRASLNDASLVPTRKALIASTRMDTISWLKQQGYASTPSESNCFMVDTRRPVKDVIAAMAAKDVYIGRPWPSCPTQARITVGLPEEMTAFRRAFSEVMAS